MTTCSWVLKLRRRLKIDWKCTADKNKIKILPRLGRAPFGVLVPAGVSMPAWGRSTVHLHPKATHRPLYSRMGALCARRATAVRKSTSIRLHCATHKTDVNVAHMQTSEARMRSQGVEASPGAVPCAPGAARAAVWGDSRRVEGAGSRSAAVKAKRSPRNTKTEAESHGRPSK